MRHPANGHRAGADEAAEGLLDGLLRGAANAMKKKVTKRSDAASRSRKLMLTARNNASLLADLRTLIRSARQRIATAANSTYTLLCWQVGRRLLRENLQAGRAAYGKQILATASQELTRSSALGSAIRPSPGWHGLPNG